MSREVLLGKSDTLWAPRLKATERPSACEQWESALTQLCVPQNLYLQQDHSSGLQRCKVASTAGKQTIPKKIREERWRDRLSRFHPSPDASPRSCSEDRQGPDGWSPPPSPVGHAVQ